MAMMTDDEASARKNDIRHDPELRVLHDDDTGFVWTHVDGVTVDRARFERLRQAVLLVLDCHPGPAGLDVLDLIQDGDTDPLP